MEQIHETVCSKKDLACPETCSSILWKYAPLWSASTHLIEVGDYDRGEVSMIWYLGNTLPYCLRLWMNWHNQHGKASNTWCPDCKPVHTSSSNNDIGRYMLLSAYFCPTSWKKTLNMSAIRALRLRVKVFSESKCLVSQSVGVSVIMMNYMHMYLYDLSHLTKFYNTHKTATTYKLFISVMHFVHQTLFPRPI